MLVMLFACWCTVLLAFVVGAVMSVFDFSEDEKAAQSYVRVSKKAAHAIERGLKYFIAKKKLYIMT